VHTLGEQIAQLKRHREELRELVELRRLEQDVEVIERSLVNNDLDLELELDTLTSSRAPDYNYTEDSNDNNEPLARRMRFDYNQASAPSCGPKIEKILVFKGKGIREYYNFESRL
jgi:hypothetical protein